MEVEAKVKGDIPENLLKKRARDEKLKVQKEKAKVTRREKNKERLQKYIKRAQNYRKEYEEADREIINLKRKARAEGGYYIPAEAKVAFVIRIRGINHLHPDIRKILKLFRLRQLHNGCFLRVNKATLNMLKRVNPYVTYGYPSRSQISNLIYKRGYGKVNGQRIPLTSNKIVEDNLGKYGIICIEDLIHEIVTCGPNFKQANNFLWPFKLRGPRGGFRIKRNAYNEGGDYGNREERINDLVKRML